MKDNGYHNVENKVDQETDEDVAHVHSGKLSESSNGYTDNELYDYNVIL